MQKKFFSILFMFVFIFTLTIPVKASSFDVEHLPNGDYIVSEISPISSDISLLSSTVTKTKTSTYYTSDNVKCWSVSVTGTFTYGNGSSSCKSASCSTSVYNSSWSTGSRKSSKSGNKATASAIGERYSNGKVVQTVSRSVTLTCSSTGQFS